MVRLIPEVVVEEHLSARVCFAPAAGDLELAVEKKEAARCFAVRVAQTRDHDVAVSQTVYGVQCAEIDLCLEWSRTNQPTVYQINTTCFKMASALIIKACLNLLGLDGLVDLGLGGLGNVDHIDARGLEADENEEATHLGRVVTARRARIPAEVMQLVARMCHAQLANDCRVSGRPGIGVHNGQLVRSSGVLATVDEHGEEQLLAWRFHRIRRTLVARTGRSSTTLQIYILDQFDRHRERFFFTICIFSFFTFACVCVFLSKGKYAVNNRLIMSCKSAWICNIAHLYLHQIKHYADMLSMLSCM